MKPRYNLALFCLLAAGLAAPFLASAALRREAHRSPSGLALLEGSLAVTANTGSGTLSLVDLDARRVLAELPAGKRPFAVAAAGGRVAVTDSDGNQVTFFRLIGRQLRSEGQVELGDEPRGVALSADGGRAFIAVAGEDSLVVVDAADRRIVGRAEVGREPWHVALTPDGAHVVVANTLSGDVCVLDSASLEVQKRVRMLGNNLRQVAISPDGEWAYVPHVSERGFSTTRVNIDQGWVIANRLGRIPLGDGEAREAIALDPRGQAVADLDGVAVSPNGELVAVAAAGTHEVLLLKHPLPFVAFGGPDDHINFRLLSDAERFRRIPLGGRPLSLRFTSDGRQIVAANFLRDSLQVLDTASGTVRFEIHLGGPAVESLERRGEALFHDGQRSFNQWYSCATCHVEGHTNGSAYDTFNDGSYGTLKKTLSLRGVTRTGPWTWLGWKKDLRALVRDSMVTTMQGPEPTEADLDAMMAYLATLDFRPNPRASASGDAAAAVRRGEAVFKKKRCDTCHKPPDYTSAGVYDVGLGEEREGVSTYNPPSLRGVGRRAPYLHDGRARTLRSVLTTYHRPSRLTGEPDLSPEDLADLIAFLRSL